MKNYTIITDMTSDLSREYLEEKGIISLPISITVGDRTYAGTYEDNMPSADFYNAMRQGATPKTSLINTLTFTETFENEVKKGNDVLALIFSSGISGTYNAARLASLDVNERYKDQKVIVVDTLSSAMGLGLLVREAQKRKEQGMSIDDLADWANKFKYGVNHIILVDSLFHLFRGGRINRATAIVGTVFNVKPLIWMDNEGHLIQYGKVMGRKKAIMAMVDQAVKRYDASICEEIDIVHADCKEDAEYLASLIEQRVGVKPTIVTMLSNILGTHVGPGMMGMVFVGKDRKPC